MFPRLLEHPVCQEKTDLWKRNLSKINIYCVVIIFGLFTPPLPLDETMAQTAIEVHAINLIEIG